MLKSKVYKNCNEEYPLAVISPTIGKSSETFILRHMSELLPGRTLVVARTKENNIKNHDIRFPNLVLSELKRDLLWFYRGSRYALKLNKLSPVQVSVENYLKLHDVQVVLSEYLDESLKWLDVSQKLGIRFYAHAHGYDVSRTLCYQAMCRKYLHLNLANGIITVSKYSRDKLIGLGLNGDNIYVVPCGIKVPETFVKRKVSDTIRCLAVGRMVAKKAPLLTLEAFRQAVADNPRLRLDYIGDGELFDEAMRYVNDHSLDKKVVLHGSKSNQIVQEFMAKSDIFIQHSIIDSLTGDEEGLPVAILEAMANGLPVVSTRHAGIPEAVTEGDNGYLVDEGDIKNMAYHIIKLASDPQLRDRLGRVGWVTAKQHFSWEKERSALLKVLGLVF